MFTPRHLEDARDAERGLPIGMLQRVMRSIVRVRVRHRFGATAFALRVRNPATEGLRYVVGAADPQPFYGAGNTWRAALEDAARELKDLVDPAGANARWTEDEDDDDGLDPYETAP